MFALAKCSYDACQLPDNNYRFIWQGIYVIVGIFVLLSNPQNFTYFQTMLFIAPVLIDIVCSGPTNKVARIVRWVVGSVDVIIMIICFLGLGGIVTQDSNSYFIVESMMLFGGFKISKVLIAILLIVNLLIPVAYYTCSPCKQSARIKAAVVNGREVKQ